MTDKPLDIPRLDDLCEAFSQSDLPFRIDIVDWSSASESFRRIIEEKCIVVQKEEFKANQWCKTPLKDVAEIRMGQSPPSSTYNEYGDGIPFFQGVKDFNYRYPSLRVFCSKPSRIAQPGDILFSVRAPIGRINIADKKCSIGRGLAIIRPRTNSDARYIEFVLRSMETKWDAIEGSGSVFGNATRKDLETLTLRWPINKQERYAIANILGTLDDKIELNRQMSETLEEMAQALFKSWFVDFDPVRAKMEGRDPGLPKHIADLFSDRLVESELGKIPEGWEVKLFEDIVNRLGDNINPLTCPDSVFSHFSIPAYDQGRAPKQELGEDIKSTKTRVPPGTVLLSKLNPEIERVWLADVMEDETAICSTEFLVLQAKPPIQRSYVYCLACNSLFREQVKSLVTGTSKSHQRAQANAITKLEVIFPTEPIVQEFESRSSGLLDHSLACRREIKILTALRDVLLPKLVSGELKTSSIQESRTG